MTTDNKTLAVDVLEVMLELDDELQLIVGRQNSYMQFMPDANTPPNP